MIQSVNAVILKTEKIHETANFYKALELPLECEHPGKQPEHYACDIGGVHFAIYALDPYSGPERRSKTRDTMVGFAVDNLEESLSKLEHLNVETVIPPEEVPWGRRAIVTDPDGRPVELSEAPGDIARETTEVTAF